MENEMIGGITLEQWKKSFANAILIAREKDYFSDILFYDLYPDTHEQAATLYDAGEYDAMDALYSEKWEYFNEAFKQIFGFSPYEEEDK
jgi:hypothetical protein